MQWMGKSRCSGRHPQVLIGIVVASLLVMVGFQAQAGIKAVSKTSRYERLQVTEQGRAPFSPHRQDCTDSVDHSSHLCGANATMRADTLFTLGLFDGDDRQGTGRVAVSRHTPRDFSNAAPRAPPRTIW